MQQRCFFTHGYQLKLFTVRPVLRGSHMLLLCVACVVLYAEWWQPAQQVVSWPRLSRHQWPRGQHISLLLVADAHVLALDSGGVARASSSLALWDSQRYVGRWFQAALTHVQPDAVVFLGDTFVTSHHGVMTSQQCHVTGSQFWRMFQVPGNVEIMAVPEMKQTDNDNDNMSGECQQLKHVFSATNYAARFTQLDFAQFLTVYSAAELENVTSSSRRPVFLLSHYPVTASDSSDTLMSLGRLRVQVIFSAQQHRSYLSVRSKVQHERVFHRHSLLSTTSRHFNLHDESVVEIVVPTCNYRSGVRRMGFGAAVISSEGSLTYAVLWLPSRHKHLAIYLATLLSCLAILFGCYLCARHVNTRKHRLMHVRAI